MELPKFVYCLPLVYFSDLGERSTFIRARHSYLTNRHGCTRWCISSEKQASWLQQQC